MLIFTFQLMPPKVIHTIVSGSGLPLAKVCLKGKTDPRRIYKKICETLVKNGIINNNTVLKWTIHDEEIMINHFIDLSELLNAINKCKVDAECVPYKSIYDITSILFQDSYYIHSSNLDKLEHLYSLKELRIRNIISDEQFIGFSRIHNLEILSFTISTNILTIPPEYKNLKNLHTLNIDGCGSRNRLIAAPRELGILQNLKSLSLTRNSIKSSTESLESITQLKNLEYLNLSNNGLTGLPDIFDKLICLQELDLSVNNISEYPIAINRIHTLESLIMFQNPLTIFSDIQLPNLLNLCLYNNYIDFVDSENIPRLEYFDLYHNDLSSIPEFIYLLQNLSKLNLDGNHIKKSDLDAYKSK
jgi:Leucine-rich repeat (LRR) protein